MSYRIAYGVGIESNMLFDALPQSTQCGRTIAIHIRQVSAIKQDASPSLGSARAGSRELHIVYHEDHISIQIESIFRFEFWVSSERILCDVLEGTPEDLIRYWCLQQIIPLFLFFSGSTDFLHGMAVGSYSRTDDADPFAPSSCMGFIGQSYAGKSTLLNYFLSRGHVLVTDDYLAMSRLDYTQVSPAIPFYRPYRALEDLGLLAERYSPNPTKLKQIYLIQPVSSNADVRVDWLMGAEALTSLLPHLPYKTESGSISTLFDEDRFRKLADMMRKVPFGRLHVPRSLDRLPEVYEYLRRTNPPGVSSSILAEEMAS